MKIIQNLWRRLDRWVARALEPDFEATSSIAEVKPSHPHIIRGSVS